MTGIAGRLLAGTVAPILLAAAFAAHAADSVPVPKLTGRVVDLTATLDRAQQQAIAEKLAAFERAKGSQVAVLLVPTIGNETIEEFATRVTDEWKLGRAGVDDGVLFVIAKQERRMRIQTGRGVQGVLTDALSRRIIAERVSPRFRAGDFGGGINEGVDAILKAIEGESLPAPPARQEHRSQAPSASSLENFFWLAFVVVPVAGAILRSLLGRFLGASLTGGVTGLAAWLAFGSLVVGGIAGVVAFVAVLLMGTAGFHVGGRGGGWTSGGSWGGGGGWSSGGGGGGFSGGGGGFDGGGASGGW